MKLFTTFRFLLAVVVLGLCCTVLLACGGDPAKGSQALTASTEGLEFYKNADGTYTVTGYAGSEADVRVITYEGQPVTAIAANAFAGNETVVTVTLGADVKTVGVAAFAGCSALVEMDAASSSLTRIGNAAFLGCDALLTVSLPASLTSVGVDAFLACDGLTSIRFGGDSEAWMHVSVGAHNDAIEDMITLANGERYEGAFRSGSCNSLVKWMMDESGVLTVYGEGHIPDYSELESAPWSAFSAEIKKIVIESGIDIVGKNAFGGCEKLTSVTFAESVRLIDDSAFYGCTALVEMILPSNLRRIGAGAFYGCNHLRDLIIPASVTHVGAGAFMNCERLAEITLSDGMTEIAPWTFSGCERLTALSIPESVQRIGVGAFYGCVVLSEVTLGGTTVTVEKNAFVGCSGLSDVVFRGGTRTVDGSNTDFLTAIREK